MKCRRSELCVREEEWLIVSSAVLMAVCQSWQTKWKWPQVSGFLPRCSHINDGSHCIIPLSLSFGRFTLQFALFISCFLTLSLSVEEWTAEWIYELRSEVFLIEELICCTRKLCQTVNCPHFILHTQVRLQVIYSNILLECNVSYFVMVWWLMYHRTKTSRKWRKLLEFGSLTNDFLITYNYMIVYFTI